MVSTPNITAKMFGLATNISSKIESALPPSYEQHQAAAQQQHIKQSSRKGTKTKGQRGSKKLNRSGSLDDSGSSDGIKPASSTATEKVDSTSNRSSSSFFGRFKQSRRPSMEMIDNSSANDSRRPSMGRRPSLGGSFTTRRSSIERRPSMDNSSSARYHNDLCSSLRRDSVSTKTSVSTSRRPSNAVSDDGRSSATAATRPPKLISETSFDYNVSYAAQKPKTHPVIEALKAAMVKDHMLDLALIANDGTRVKTCRYIMACRVESLEQRLYPTINSSIGDEEKEKGDAAHPPEQPDEISLGDYPPKILDALVEYCFCGELIKSTLKTEETAESVRGMVQLAELAGNLQFRVLGDETYQWARRMMNRNPSLACVVYNVATSTAVKEFENYAVQTIEDSPMDALLRGGAECGIHHLSAKRLEDVFRDHDMEVDELTAFHMLQRWVEHHTSPSRSDVAGAISPEEAVEVARKCAKSIVLCYIEPTDLLSTIKTSGLFDAADIDKAIAEQGKMASERGGVSTFGMTRGVGSLGKNLKNLLSERVEIQGAGMRKVNGIYVRETDRDGQAMYSMGEGPDSIGLFQWENTWGIAPSCDLSNMYYECNQVISGKSEPNKVPMYGWTVSLQGENPPPSCRWIAAHTEQDDEENEKHLPACFQSEEDLYGN
eukprot:CAMPEP_0119013898 /NCGR_PEP_ID=MMETSP1176-20130426/9188_1 /TAXON_ID=265551 /ORGANISM="Synedropsis recta cf, Strain CCMP1620" /LENGTH=660 /DNA_ID=CAMNT_0006967025 /DNA_START=86 /DNA_END=2068 /DNA_ORIENTATION=+